jgi:enoyl-CoA hydratase/carnithine racemase
MKNASYSTLTWQTEGPLLRLVLNRPDAFNALNEQAMDELLDCFTRLASDDDIRIVELSAAGRHFCAGFDLGENSSGLHGLPLKDGMRLQRKVAALVRVMRRVPQPVIVLIQGAACGGGFSLALAADIRIAADDARFNAAYIRIGLSGADMGASYLLPRLVGLSVASELLLTGHFMHADRALAVNLVSAVVPRARLAAAADEYIEGMLAASPMGLRLTKDALNWAVDAPSMEAAQAIEDRQQVLLGQTADHAEAVRAFQEKRRPNYRDG